MKVSEAEFQNMKEDIVKDMISWLMDERGLSIQEAFDAVYTSRLFEKLNDPKTGLYFHSEPKRPQNPPLTATSRFPQNTVQWARRMLTQ